MAGAKRPQNRGGKPRNRGLFLHQSSQAAAIPPFFIHTYIYIYISLLHLTVCCFNSPNLPCQTLRFNTEQWFLRAPFLALKPPREPSACDALSYILHLSGYTHTKKKNSFETIPSLNLKTAQGLKEIKKNTLFCHLKKKTNPEFFL